MVQTTTKYTESNRMSIQTPGVQNSNDRDESQQETIEVSEEAFYQLIERVQDLEQTNEGLREENTILQSRLDALDEAIDQNTAAIEENTEAIENLEQSESEPAHASTDTVDSETKTSSELHERVIDLEQSRDIHESRLNGLNDAIDRVDSELDQSSPQGSDSEEQAPESTHDTLTPIERVLDDPKSSGIRLTKSVDRALTILTHFPDWASKTVDGRVIAPSDTSLLKMMNTARVENLCWKQVHRACEKLEELSDGMVEWVNDQDAGRCLKIKDENQELLTNVVSG